jgi:Tol biopolymer transport system component
VAVTRNESHDRQLEHLAARVRTEYADAVYRSKVGDANPVWSPDGAYVAYDSLRSARSGLYRKASNGAGGEDVLLEPSGRRDLDDWSRDGRYLLYSQVDSRTKSDLWVMPLDGKREPEVYVNSEFNETHGQFSPGGRWIAYESDESGRPEIYVRPFPLAADSVKWPVSNGGGVAPRGGVTGVVFLTPDFRTVMAADVTYAPRSRLASRSQ